MCILEQYMNYRSYMGLRNLTINEVPSVAYSGGGVLEESTNHPRTFSSRYMIELLSILTVMTATKVSNIRGFASSNAIQILVINIDAFAKDENIINKPK